MVSSIENSLKQNVSSLSDMADIKIVKVHKYSIPLAVHWYPTDSRLIYRSASWSGSRGSTDNWWSIDHHVHQASTNTWSNIIQYVDLIIWVMTSSVSGHDEPNLLLWLATRACKMELSRDTGFVPQGKFIMFWCFISYNKYFIGQACSVKMAGYWPCSFFACLWTLTLSWSINTPSPKKKDNIQPSWPHTCSITHILYWSICGSPRWPKHWWEYIDSNWPVMKSDYKEIGGL